MSQKILNPDNRFIAILVKGALWYLTNNIIMYNKPLRHIIVNTGDEYMYLEAANYKYIPGSSVNPYGYKVDAKGNCLPCQNYSTDLAFQLAQRTTNEDHIYFPIPRCNVDFSSVAIDPSQLTSPYSRGIFQEVQEDGQIFQYSAEFRRLPVSIEMNLTYYLDSFNDVLVLTEKLLSHFAFIKNFYITFMGVEIMCSLTFPESVEHEKNLNIEFDSENRARKITLTLNLASSMPVINEQTKIRSDKVITGWVVNGEELHVEGPSGENINYENINETNPGSGTVHGIYVEGEVRPDLTPAKYITPAVIMEEEKSEIATPENPFQG